MPRPTIEYLERRRALKPASGGKIYSCKAKYASENLLRWCVGDGLKTAIETVGGVRALASLLGLHSQTIYHWRRVPAERVVQIETVTDVPRNVLRPDLYEGWQRQAPSKPLTPPKPKPGQYTYAQFLEMAAKGEVKARPIGFFKARSQ